MKPAWVFLLCAAPLFSCRFHSGRHVAGNGQEATIEKTVGDFSEVEAGGHVNLHVTKGDLKPVKLTGDENLLSLLEVSEENGKLTIEPKHGYDLDASHAIEVWVTAPRFKSIEISGAGDIVSENKIETPEHLSVGASGAGNINMDIDAPAVTADISGAGDVVLKGQTRDFELSISGIGNAKCFDLLSENTKVEISGAGSAQVYASVSLDAGVSGAGSIHYKGKAPKVTKDVSGAGSVEEEK